MRKVSWKATKDDTLMMSETSVEKMQSPGRDRKHPRESYSGAVSFKLRQFIGTHKSSSHFLVKSQPKSVCIYYFLFDLDPNGIPFGFK